MSIADKYRMERGLPPRDNPEDVWKLKLRKLKRRGVPQQSSNILGDFWNSLNKRPSFAEIKKLEEEIFIRHTIGMAYRLRRADGIDRLVEMVLSENYIVKLLEWLKQENVRFSDEGGHISQTRLMLQSNDKEVECAYNILFKRKTPCDRRIIGLELYHFGLSFEHIKQLARKIEAEHPPSPNDKGAITEYLAQMIQEGHKLHEDRELLQACIYGCGFSQAQTDEIEGAVLAMAGVSSK